MPVTKNNSNYASVVLAILTTSFAVSWLKARTDFTGGAKDLSPGLASPRALPPFRQPSSEDTIRRFKSPLDRKARIGNGHNKVLPEQATGLPRPGYPTSLTPPRRDPILSSSSSKRQQQHQKQQSTTRAGLLSRSSPRDQFRDPASNLTMNTVTSVQNHPDSILGIPFSESPEMMHRELSTQYPSSSSSASPPPATGVIATDTQSTASSGAVSSGLFLTRPFGLSIAIIDAAASSSSAGNVPEISIAPPTTNSSTIESARSTPRCESPPPHTLAIRVVQKAIDGASVEKKVILSQPSAPETTTNHPLSAIDSIFKLGQGLSNIFTPSKHKVTANMSSSPSDTNRLRTGKTAH
ncbi:hypothetical protein BGW39_009500 [Mortierella sp. 14UC]|nr:hypothetical protein BGW39_009500 [Mortierella sp. 14UC]